MFQPEQNVWMEHVEPLRSVAGASKRGGEYAFRLDNQIPNEAYFKLFKRIIPLNSIFKNINSKGTLPIFHNRSTHKPGTVHSHEYWMQRAIAEACKAQAKDEVPIGCIIVRADKIIARGHNLRETSQDPAGHAELIAIRKAARKLGSWRLLDTVLYVTLEPCTMCMGAIILARIPKVVFGCYDPKGGAAGSLFDLSNDPRLNHRVELLPRILENECSGLLTDFFADLRKRRRKDLIT